MHLYVIIVVLSESLDLCHKILFSIWGKTPWGVYLKNQHPCLNYLPMPLQLRNNFVEMTAWKLRLTGMPPMEEEDGL